MAVLLTEVANRLQRLDPLRPRLTDSDQDPGRQRDAGNPGGPDRRQTAGRQLVRRSEVGTAASGQPL
jgi:hypothetical protein